MNMNLEHLSCQVDQFQVELAVREKLVVLLIKYRV